MTDRVWLSGSLPKNEDGEEMMVALSKGHVHLNTGSGGRHEVTMTLAEFQAIAQRVLWPDQTH